MSDFSEIFLQAFRLIYLIDEDLFEIIILSLKVSFSALIISTIISLPLGVMLAINDFGGKTIFLIFFNALMGLPPVLIGLVLYILFSASGPLGFLEILYTPSIMIIAQIILIIPIIVSLSKELLQEIYLEYEELLNSLGATKIDIAVTIIWDARYLLLTCILAGLGRAMSEVGAIMIVGGNILHLTRVMTTTIALETSKGNLELAIALGLILITISFVINFLVYVLKILAQRYSYD